MRSSPWTGGLPPWQLWTARLIWPWATSTRWDTCPRACPVKAFSPEKDASDMELALEEALARGADAVEVYGALGGRLDHTVANLQLLASFAERGLAVAAVGERERIAFLVGPRRAAPSRVAERYRVGVLADRCFCRGRGRRLEVRP